MGPVAPPDPVLQWDAPDACPDRASVAAGIEALATSDRDRPAVSAFGTVLATDEGWALTLRLDTPRGTQTRELSSPSCESLARAAALVIAVELDPIAVAKEMAAPPAEPVPPPATTPTVASPSPVEPPPTPAPPAPAAPPAHEDAPPRAPAPRTVRFGLRPELSLGIGLLPGVGGAGVGGAFAAFGRRPWRVEAGGAFWFPRRASVTGSADSGGRISLGSGIVRGCGVPSPGPIELPVCGGIELGRVRGEGFGPDVAAGTATALWVGLSPSVALIWAPQPFLGLYTRLEGTISARRPAFHLDGIGPVDRIGAFGARASFGVEVRL